MPYLLFFCSGLSGLIYQVVWVRAFGNVLGNTIYSASLVVAVFMLGLGAGSYAAGAWADRRYAKRPDSLLRTFGVFELLIGAMAMAVAWLLPQLGEISALASSYVRGADGWYTPSLSSYLARAVLVVALLIPITLLMGGTLTLLIRHLVRHDVGAGGWRIAVLYGINTAGAATGCLLTDIALVPMLGLGRTQAVAFAFNVLAGVGAIALGRAQAQVRWEPDTRVRLKPDTTYQTPDATYQKPDTAPAKARIRGARLPAYAAGSGEARQSAQPAQMWQADHTIGESTIAWATLAIALAGFAAMGMEIVWFRHFSILLGEYRAVFSLLLAIVLSGIGAGSLVGGWLHRRTRRPAEAWMIVQGLFVASTVLGLLSADAREIRDAAANPAVLDGWRRIWSESWFNATAILAVAGIPSLLMGLSFPLANGLAQDVESQVGRRAGLLYLANTAGAVGGSLAAGFLLLPVLGSQRSATVLLTIAALAIAPLYAATRADGRPGTAQHTARASSRGLDERRQPRRAGWALAGSLAAAGVALAVWVQLPPNYLIGRALLFPLDRAYAMSEGLTEVIAVTDGPDGGRVLVTNGHPMSSTELFSQRYMRAMAHIPLLSVDGPKRVLVLCYGVGNTAHAATLHDSVERVDIVDLSAHVLRHSSYFKDVNHDVLQDPRVRVHVNDGRDHLRMEPPGSYDLITLEPPPVVHAGVAALYSREFYVSARSRLTPEGYISQWLPVFGVPHAIVLSMVRAFVDVFPNAVLLSGAGTNLLLIGGRDPRVDPARLTMALSKAPAVRADLARLDLGTVRELVGTFVGDAATLSDATRESAPVTDDRPIQEYGKRSLIDFGEGGIPPALIAVNRVASWCPYCFSNGRPSPVVDGLDRYLSLTELAYRSPQAGSAPPAALGGDRKIAGSGYLGAIVPDSPELQRILAQLPSANSQFPIPNSQTPPQPGPAEDGFGELPDLRRAVELNPSSSAARYALATALLESGQPAEAIEHFRAVLRLSPDSAQALNNLGVALASVGRLGDAIEQFERALVVSPAFDDARRNLALARSKTASSNR